MVDESEYSVLVHGEQRDIPVVEIEIRQDPITTVADQQKWASLLKPILRRAVDEVLGGR